MDGSQAIEPEPRKKRTTDPSENDYNRADEDGYAVETAFGTPSVQSPNLTDSQRRASRPVASRPVSTLSLRDAGLPPPAWQQPPAWESPDKVGRSDLPEAPAAAVLPLPSDPVIVSFTDSSTNSISTRTNVHLDPALGIEDSNVVASVSKLPPNLGSAPAASRNMLVNRSDKTAGVAELEVAGWKKVSPPPPTCSTL